MIIIDKPFKNSFSQEEEKDEPFQADCSSINSFSIPNESIKYHYTCNRCNYFPIISFIDKEKIKWCCQNDCENNNKIILIQDVFNYITPMTNNINYIKCKMHKRLYDLYCEEYKRNRCYFCQKKCYDKGHNLIHNNNPKTFNKASFIVKKIKEAKTINLEKQKNIKESIEQLDESDNIPTVRLLPDNDNKNLYNKIPVNMSDVNNIEKNPTSIEVLMEKQKEKEIEDENEENLFFFINIILYDYINYPNYSHIENINNIEKIIIKYYCNERIYLEYRPSSESNKSTKIFGDKFVEKNKNNCNLIIQGEVIELVSSINFCDYYKDIQISNLKGNLQVILVIKDYNQIIDMSYMFYEASSLVFLKYNSIFNTDKVTNMSYMFYNCTSLKSLPCISQFKMDNVINISYMFYGCISLKSLYYFKFCSSSSSMVVRHPTFYLPNELPPEKW